MCVRERDRECVRERALYVICIRGDIKPSVSWVTAVICIMADRLVALQARRAIRRWVALKPPLDPLDPWTAEKSTRPCLVANRTILPQKWPPPPPGKVADSGELTATTERKEPCISSGEEGELKLGGTDPKHFTHLTS